MTLARQLLAGILVAFAALLIGIEAISVRTARNYLEEQLDAHANETATSLALSLGTRSDVLNATVAEIMVSPVFDRGHFQSIEVRSPEGVLVYSRQLEAREIDVPGWFVSLVPLKGPTGEALISSGWTELGRIAVQVHPGYAYRQLLDTALATLGWLVGLFALALVAVRYYLAGILKPLREIEQTALAISNREFISIETQPRARELQRVTAAMNSLSGKVRDAIREESDRAERLRREAFEDPLTAQLNRRGFDQAFAAMLDNRSEIHSGALALFQVPGADESNLALAGSQRDALLKRLGEALAAPGPGGVPVVGRWQGATLAALVPNAESQAALAWGSGLCSSFSARLREEDHAAGLMLCCGLSHFAGEGVSTATLAAAAEAALARAAKSGGAVLADAPAGGVASAADLKAEIQSAIEAGRIRLLGQKVSSIDGEDILQMELLCSLIGSAGNPIPAGTFVPVASHDGLLPSLDRAVTEKALLALESVESLPWTVAVNVSMQSIADKGFRASLRDLLLKKKSVSRRLIFEITGYAASRSPELTHAFSEEVHRLGARVALDNFDLDRNAMGMVNKLLPAYIKLSPAFTHEVEAHEELRFMIESMVRMLRPLEIPLIAQGVESPGSTAILAELGLSGYQGYALGRPEPIAGI